MPNVCEFGVGPAASTTKTRPLTRAPAACWGTCGGKRHGTVRMRSACRRARRRRTWQPTCTTLRVRNKHNDQMPGWLASTTAGASSSNKSACQPTRCDAGGMVHDCSGRLHFRKLAARTVGVVALVRVFDDCPLAHDHRSARVLRDLSAVSPRPLTMRVRREARADGRARSACGCWLT